MDYKKIAMIAGLAVAGLATASGLKAFPNTDNWTDDPSQGLHCGGGDIWGNGSVKDWGITCTHCHINDKNQQGSITAQITFSPALSGGHYATNTDYTVTVKLVGEHLGIADPANNLNGFTARFEDVNGNT